MDTSNSHRADDDPGGPDAFIHREILQIGALMVIAVIAFFATRAVAANNRETTVRDAEAWYEQGERLMNAGRIDEAVASLRRASVRNRYERKYALTLANALERKGDTEAARAALLTLREASPEDAEVNLALARLAAERQDVTEALRFYHNALYAPWPAESAGDRRDVRFELIEFFAAQTGRPCSVRAPCCRGRSARRAGRARARRAVVYPGRRRASGTGSVRTRVAAGTSR